MSLLVTSLGTTPRYAGIFRRYLLCKTYLLIQTYVTATVNHKIANVIPHIDWNVGLQRINTKRGTFRGRSEPVGAPFLENNSHRLSALWVLRYLNSSSENSYPKKEHIDLSKIKEWHNRFPNINPDNFLCLCTSGSSNVHVAIKSSHTLSTLSAQNARLKTSGIHYRETTPWRVFTETGDETRCNTRDSLSRIAVSTCLPNCL